MLESRPLARTVAKVLLAGILMGAVLWVAGRSLAPSMPLRTLLLCLLVVVGAFVGVSGLWAALNLHLRRWIVRHGGTGPQVFWFNSKPRGPAALRKNGETQCPDLSRK